MARICSICSKGKQVGHTRKLLRGHYNVTANRTFKPNLQFIRHNGTRVLVCTQCMRTLAKPAKNKAQ